MAHPQAGSEEMTISAAPQASLLLLARSRFDPGRKEPNPRLVEALAERRHRPVATMRNWFDYLRALASVGPGVSIKCRCAEHGVAGAVRTMAGNAVLLEQRATGSRCSAVRPAAR